MDLDRDTELVHRSNRASIEEIADIDNATWPAVISRSANKPGFDMIHYALNNTSLRGNRQVGTALATAIQFAPAISNFMGQLIKPLIHTIQACNKNHQYNRDILSQALPKIVAHSNIGYIQHVQAIQKNIQNGRFDNLMNI